MSRWLTPAGPHSCAAYALYLPRLAITTTPQNNDDCPSYRLGTSDFDVQMSGVKIFKGD
jgi:hypothetical protein